MTECFMFAAMSKDDVDSYNYKMMIFSAVFLGASWYLTILGSVGFVIANCLNMLLRIYHRLVESRDNKYGLLTKCEVKMAGYWPSSFLRVYGLRRSRGP